MGGEKKSLAAFSSVHSLFLSLVANLKKKKTHAVYSFPSCPWGEYNESWEDIA